MLKLTGESSDGETINLLQLQQKAGEKLLRKQIGFKADVSTG